MIPTSLLFKHMACGFFSVIITSWDKDIYYPYTR